MSLRLQGAERGGCFGEFSHGWLTAAVRAGVDLPTPHLTHSRAPGGRATRARHDKAQGLFAALAGGLTFPGHRSEVKETLPEGRPLTTLAWQSLVKGLRSHNNTLVLHVEITIRVTLITYYNKHTCISFFFTLIQEPPGRLVCSSPDAGLHFLPSLTQFQFFNLHMKCISNGYKNAVINCKRHMRY